MKMWPVKMTGEVTGQGAFLAGHCPLTGRYFEPCLISVLLENSEVQLVSGNSEILWKTKRVVSIGSRH
jgi:hypothetical protein